MAKQEIDAGAAFQHLSTQLAASGDAYATLSNQMANLTSAIGAHGISQFIPPFEGDPSKFKQWIKSIEKYALLTKLTDERTMYVTYQAARGGVSDFISRLINVQGQTWANLKAELTARFAEISDHMQAFSLLKKIKQGPSENVQLFAERLLALARDAFQGQDGNNVAVERQQAVRAALNEQNLRKRFQIRSGREYGPVRRHDESRAEEPMDVDHYRPPRRCFKCNKKGHVAANCRSNYGPRTNRVNAVNTPQKQSNGRQYPKSDIVCWHCGKKGHTRRNCDLLKNKEPEN